MLLGTSHDAVFAFFVEALRGMCDVVKPASEVTEADVAAADAVVVPLDGPQAVGLALPPRLQRRVQRLVLWNTEQMTRVACVQVAVAEVARTLQLLQQAPREQRHDAPSLEVWDYARANMRLLRPLLPAGVAYRFRAATPAADDVAELRRLLGVEPKTYDLGFTGALSPRRVAALHALHAAGLRVLSVGGFGADRDRLLARCRALVNIHYADDYGVFEVVRCGRWMAAGMPLLTERALGGCDEDDPAPSSTVVVARYDGLVDAARRMLLPNP
jgi:hypothetical protein